MVAPPTARTSPVRILLLATRFELPYRVLRCAKASGAEIYVLGNSSASPLRLSRHCKRFFLSEHSIRGEADHALAEEIRRMVRKLSIAMLVPGDDISMRTLIANEDSLLAPCFPHPTLRNFDLLNDKWAFAGLCAELSLPHPGTRLLADRAALMRAAGSCGPERTLLAKPLSSSGGDGIVILDGVASEERVQSILYQPILVQEFIHGTEIGASLYASKGAVQAFLTHSYHRKTYIAYHDQRIHADLERLVRHLDLDGVYNFDIMTTPDGSLYYLECNPRFFHKMNMSLVAGMNFVAPGLPGLPCVSHRPAALFPVPARLRMPEASLRGAPWRMSRGDLDMAAYFLSDPLPYLLEKSRLHSLMSGAPKIRYYRAA